MVKHLRHRSDGPPHEPGVISAEVSVSRCGSVPLAISCCLMVGLYGLARSRQADGLLDGVETWRA
jgi:hypothetical protein